MLWACSAHFWRDVSTPGNQVTVSNIKYVNINPSEFVYQEFRGDEVRRAIENVMANLVPAPLATHHALQLCERILISLEFLGTP